MLLAITIQCDNFTFDKATSCKELLGCVKKGEEAAIPAEKVAPALAPAAAADY